MFDQKTLMFDEQIRSALKKVGTLHESSSNQRESDEAAALELADKLFQANENTQQLIMEARENAAIVRLLKSYNSSALDDLQKGLAAFGELVSDLENLIDANSEYQGHALEKEVEEDVEEDLEGKYANLQPIGSLPKPDQFLKLFKSKKYDWMFKVYEGEEDEDGDINFINLDEEMSELKSKGWKTYNVDNEGIETTNVIYYKQGTGKVTDGDDLVMEAKKTDEIDLEELAAEIEGKYDIQPIDSLGKKKNDFLKKFASKKFDWAFKVYEIVKSKNPGYQATYKGLDKDTAAFKANGWKVFNKEELDGETDAVYIYFKSGTGKVKKTP